DRYAPAQQVALRAHEVGDLRRRDDAVPIPRAHVSANRDLSHHRHLGEVDGEAGFQLYWTLARHGSRYVTASVVACEPAPPPRSPRPVTRRRTPPPSGTGTPARHLRRARDRERRSRAAAR